MAHTLKAYYYTDPATAVTVDFYGAVATNSGIAVDSYQMGIPGIEQARNNSLYSDSPRPVYSKHGTVTDVLTVTVRGSTNTNLYTNLHLLAKLGEYARLSAENAVDNYPPYLTIKPGGSAAGEILYARIFDCRVELPEDWANHVDATLTIEDVTVTIERGLWRPSDLTASYLETNLSEGPTYHANGAGSSASIAGDTTALVDIYVTQNLGGGTSYGQIDRAIIGFRSKALGGSSYNALGKFESESATNGTDTSDAADATASGGNKVVCTFGTVATAAVRSSGAAIPRGVHRMFARMKVTGSAVASVYLAYCDESAANAGEFANNAAVTVSSTSWLVYDLGIVRAIQNQGVVSLGTYQIYASRSSGAGNLDIDWVFCMPTEGYITAQGLNLVTTGGGGEVFNYQNGLEHAPHCITYITYPKALRKPRYTASITPPPGAFYLYWLLGTDTGDVFDVGIYDGAEIGLRTVPRYIMPSEV